MTTQTVNGDGSLNFRTHSRLTVLRDVAVIAAIAAIVGGFLAQVWTAPGPTQMRTAPEEVAAQMAR